VAAAAAWPNPAGGAEHVPFVNSKLSIDPGRSSSTTWDTIVTRTYSTPFASETGGEGRQNTSNLQDFALFSSDAEAEGSLAYWNS
jgi:hypothetical protein